MTATTVDPASLDDEADAEAITRARHRRVRYIDRNAMLGLAAVIVVFLGVSSMWVFSRPYFEATDENAHLAYAHVIADFDLPTITGEPPVPEEATLWQTERASSRDVRYRTVWVANHPPLFYMATAPLIWLSNALDRHDGGLVFIRFANIAFAAAGLVFVYLLGVEASGGVRRLGVAAAAVAGLVGLSPAAFSLAQNDGLGFAAAAAVLWGVARVYRRPGLIPTRNDLIVIAVSASVAAGVRTATMLMAAGAIGMLFLTMWMSTERPWKDRWPAMRKLALWGVGLPVALFGWYSVRNHVLYGDLGASEFLLDRFRRAVRGPVPTMLFEGQIWHRLFRRVTTPSVTRDFVIPGIFVIAAIAVAGFVIAYRNRRTADTRADGKPGHIDRRVIWMMLASVFVILATVAQHLAGGGMAHSRYLFPALPVLAVIAVIGFDQFLPRIGPFLLSSVFAWWVITTLPTTADRVAMRRRRWRNVADVGDLRQIPGSTTLRVIAAIVIIAGCLLGAIYCWRAIIGKRRAAELFSVDEDVEGWVVPGGEPVSWVDATGDAGAGNGVVSSNGHRPARQLTTTSPAAGK